MLSGAFCIVNFEINFQCQNLLCKFLNSSILLGPYGPDMKSCDLALQDLSNLLVEDEVTSEASVADIGRFIPRVPPSPSISHIMGIGQLLESVSSTFPMPMSEAYSILIYAK